jgi:hypothetical protein
MHSVLLALVGMMERDIKDQCDRRYQALVWQYRYLVETQNEHLIFTYSQGWFSERYKVLFALNSFFQIVIGPLASSSRGVSEVGVGSSIPINYGASIKFDEARNHSINKVYSDFINLVNEFGIDEWWLNLNQANDITYQIAKKLRSDEQQP